MAALTARLEREGRAEYARNAKCSHVEYHSRTTTLELESWPLFVFFPPVQRGVCYKFMRQKEAEPINH